METATRRQLAGVAGLAALAAGAALLFSPAGVVGALEGLADRPVPFIAALAGVYLVRPFLLWPVSSVAVALGYLYGPAPAMGLALAGAALTALPPFLIGRHAETDAGLFGSLGSSGARAARAVGETRSVVAARLSPVPGDAVSYWAGLSGVSARPFVAGTVVGEIPWAAAAVLAGASMRTLSVEGVAAGPALVLVLAVAALIVLAGPAYEHVLGRGDRSGDG